MDLSNDHFYKTIEEAKSVIKQYSKVHYFIRLICPQRINKNVIRREPPSTPRRINKILFVGNRPRRIKKLYSSGNVPHEYKKFYSSGFPTNNDDHGSAASVLKYIKTQTTGQNGNSIIPSSYRNRITHKNVESLQSDTIFFS